MKQWVGLRGYVAWGWNTRCLKMSPELGGARTWQTGSLQPFWHYLQVAAHQTAHAWASAGWSPQVSRRAGGQGPPVGPKNRHACIRAGNTHTYSGRPWLSIGNWVVAGVMPTQVQWGGKVQQFPPKHTFSWTPLLKSKHGGFTPTVKKERYPISPVWGLSSHRNFSASHYLSASEEPAAVSLVNRSHAVLWALRSRLYSTIHGWRGGKTSSGSCDRTRHFPHCGKFYLMALVTANEMYFHLTRICPLIYNYCILHLVSLHNPATTLLSIYP